MASAALVASSVIARILEHIHMEVLQDTVAAAEDMDKAALDMAAVDSMAEQDSYIHCLSR